MLGSHPESKVLFLDVRILESTGRYPYRGDVLIEHERFTKVGQVDNVEELQVRAKRRSGEIRRGVKLISWSERPQGPRIRG